MIWLIWNRKILWHRSLWTCWQIKYFKYICYFKFRPNYILISDIYLHFTMGTEAKMYEILIQCKNPDDKIYGISFLQYLQVIFSEPNIPQSCVICHFKTNLILWRFRIWYLNIWHTTHFAGSGYILHIASSWYSIILIIIYHITY